MTQHRYFFDLPMDTPTTLQIHVSTASGTLDMQITGPDDVVYFEGHDLSERDGPYTCYLPASGT